MLKMCLKLVCKVTRLVVHGDVWACGGIGDDLESRNGPRCLKECVHLVELLGHLRCMERDFRWKR